MCFKFINILAIIASKYIKNVHKICTFYMVGFQYYFTHNEGKWECNSTHCFLTSKQSHENKETFFCTKRHASPHFEMASNQGLYVRKSPLQGGIESQ